MACHHEDGDVTNNSLDNLHTLCENCHNKTSGTNVREYYQQVFLLAKIFSIIVRNYKGVI